MGDAERLAEVGQVRAAAHADVLTGIDELPAGGIGERAGPAAEPAARFEQRDAKSARRQGLRRREACAIAADDEDAGIHFHYHLPLATSIAGARAKP